MTTRIRLRAALPAVAASVCLLWSPAIAPAHADETHPRGAVGGPLLGSIGVVSADRTSTLPEVSAKSFLVADLASGDVLAAKNAHGQFRPASAMKVLTAVTLLPRLSPDRVYTATFGDANVEGSKVGIVPEGTYTVHNLFEGLFLTSGNDAANALAGADGGLAKTVSRMNAKAKELGAFDTTAKNTSGLDERGQYSSAYDLALIAREGMKRSDFRAYARTVKSSFPDKPAPPGKRRGDFEIYTQNKLVLNYPGAIGIKTGWTTQARGTFIGAATRDGRTLLVTVMNTRQGAWREGAALLDWGFANIAAQKPVGTLNAIPEVTLSNGTNGETDPSRATTPAAAATDDSSSMRWLAWPLLTLVVLVAALRTRVLVRRHLRRRRRQADLRLSKRLNATGDQVPYQEDERLAPPHRDDPRETRINRSA